MEELLIRDATLRDVPAILAVARASDIALLGEPDWTEEEVVATLTAPGNESWLACGAGGTPLAWAYVDSPAGSERDNVEVYATPGVAAHGRMLDLALPRVSARARAAGRPAVTLRAGVVPSEVAYVEALVARGFGFRKRHARMSVSLADVASTGEFDGSVRVARTDDPAELRRFHEVLQAAFADTTDFEPVSYADWISSVPPHSPDEWLVAEVAGRIVGVLQSSDQGVERGEGWVKNLAVLRDQRRRGVGGALLRRAFAVYAGKGRTSAGLGVDLTNPTGAYSLYTGVGMRVAFAVDVYEREVVAASG